MFSVKISINCLCPINSKVVSIIIPSPWLMALLFLILTLHGPYSSALRKKENRFAEATIMPHYIFIVNRLNRLVTYWFHSILISRNSPFIGFKNTLSTWKLFIVELCWYSFTATIPNPSLVSIFSNMVTENSTEILLLLYITMHNISTLLKILPVLFLV